MTDVVIGVDVGTGSARAGVFDLSGRSLGRASRNIRMWRPEPDYAEQSSDDIWNAVCVSVREALAEAGKGLTVRGIGFDATCSLVVVDDQGKPVTASPTGRDEQNVIVWMDHRAIGQAERINASGHDILRYVGNTISPEMETPKLLWLKENMPATWQRAAHFFDLPDFLTWRATGTPSRSLCSTVCKWTYLGHEGRWDESYFRQVGLGQLADEDFRRIGQEVLPMATPVGRGLSAEAAAEFGLPAGIPVATSIIDAHAGGIGVIGAAVDGIRPDQHHLENRLALIGGTSSCHMVVSEQARFVPGVWGPYFSAMIPGMWLNEGGQSATGALIDFVVRSHARGKDLETAAQAAGQTVYESLNRRLDTLAAQLPFAAALTHETHVLPYFHGNRSPRANPTLRGMISGLQLSDTEDDLARLYLATIQAVAYGTRHIIEALAGQGYRIDTILICGGGTKNPIYLREHADATGCRLILAEEPEAVLLGSAVLGAVAGQAFDSVTAAMGAMTRSGTVIEPAGGATAAYHNAKYDVFKRMYDDQMAYRSLMGKYKTGLN
ncbi:FGGY-family carbohydrate kinase [Telmatospirillum sp.]|uniref:FGGY-family carbohydrate kinase n=1 Tax=Telmatospirillum sp. TaxID=2079197 RepID=UPI00283BE58C|nr:FGGY-family carbohydrate kinase [Telmatospirillum sp.]MDR3437040.1 FGGY-family carbohydrate kinase [Telmatospirillum sp.]